MKGWSKRSMGYALAFAVGAMVSGGTVFATTGTFITALYANANIDNSYTGYQVNTSQIIYNGIPYINSTDLLGALSNAGIPIYWNGQTLTLNHVGTTSNATATTNYATTTTISSAPSTYASANSSQAVSLFDFPQFAEGTGDSPGSTTIYSSFVDIFGNRYLEPAMCWNTSGTTPNTNNLTLGNTLGEPYGSQILSQNISFQPFNSGTGTAGTFSKIYNLRSGYADLTFTLAPSAYYNSVPVNSNIGSLEIINMATGTDIYNYGNFNSDVTTPVQYSVPLYGVSQIEVIFHTDGLGLINPQLVK